MPITLTVPEGLLSADAEAAVFAVLTDALLTVVGLHLIGAVQRTAAS